MNRYFFSALLTFVVFLLLGVSAVSARAADSTDGRINADHYFGGDELYCMSSEGAATNDYAVMIDGGEMRLLNDSGKELWSIPAATIASAIAKAQATKTGVLVATETGSYGPMWLYTYIDGNGDTKFVFVGSDDHGKTNSMEFKNCEQDDTQHPQGALVCPDSSSPSGTGEEVPGHAGCFCPDGELWGLLGDFCTISVPSDENIKENFTPVDSQAILQKVASLPLSEWDYIAQNGVRHIGPMAQDFLKTFGFGNDPTHINIVDTNGVALAAVQGLYAKVQDQQAQLDALEQRNTELTAVALGVVVLIGGVGGVAVLKRRRQRI